MLSRCAIKNTPKFSRSITSACSVAGPSMTTNCSSRGKPSTITCTSHDRIPMDSAYHPFGGNLSRITGNLGLVRATRCYSTESGSSTTESRKDANKPGGLFDKDANPWDHVFAGIEDMPPLNPAQVQLPPDRSMPHATPRTGGSSSLQRQFRKQPRQQNMNQTEVGLFQEMFDTIFSAARTQPGVDRPFVPNLLEIFGTSMGGQDGSSPLTAAGIGMRPDGTSSVGDIMHKLRRHARSTAPWGAQEDAELERKKEEIETCVTDRELLEWAMREVFGESIRYEEEARRAVMRAEERNRSNNDGSTSSNPDNNSVAEAPTNSTASEHPLQPPAFPFLLAELMRTFRDKFHDPHLALSLFTFARTRSIASYVFGCTTPAYNELLRSRWTCFHDLRGVADALREMHANGVPPDTGTRLLVEEVRREVGLRTVWQEERDLGNGEVLQILDQIERYVQFDMSRQRSKSGQRNGKRKVWNKSAERWKLDRDFERKSGWKFNDWKVDGQQSPGRTQHRTNSQDQFAFA